MNGKISGPNQAHNQGRRIPLEKILPPLEKYNGHSSENLSPSRKILRPSLCPKLVTGLALTLVRYRFRVFSKWSSLVEGLHHNYTVLFKIIRFDFLSFANNQFSGQETSHMMVQLKQPICLQRLQWKYSFDWFYCWETTNVKIYEQRGRDGKTKTMKKAGLNPPVITNPIEMTVSKVSNYFRPASSLFAKL